LNFRRSLAAAALLSASVALSQGAAPKKDEMKKEPAADAKAGAKADAPPAMPVLPPEGKRWVESPLGKWKSNDMQLTLGGGAAMAGKITMNCDKAAGGWAATCHGKFEVKGMPAQEAIFTMGWAIGEGQAHMHEMTNYGDVHDHKGKWTDDKTITVVQVGKNAEGKEETDNLTFVFNSPRELVMKGEGTVGGAQQWTINATLKK
jgi:hypothetical protein